MEDVIHLITQKENRRLEFKRELPSLDKIIKTAIAFSNSQGGHLIIGIDDQNQLVGIPEESITQYEEMISSALYDNCYPVIFPEIFSVKRGDYYLLVCYFYPSNNKPHYIKTKGKRDSTYIRVGASNRVASQDVIEALERQRRQISYDAMLNHHVLYRAGVFKSFDMRIRNLLQQEPNLATYEKLKLLKEEGGQYFLTNLGVLFSDKKSDYFPLAKIECARFKGVSTQVFLDQATFEGDLIDSIEGSIEFIKKNIRLGATIGEIYRENRWEYPLLAMREVVINAVVHRDYAITGSDIKIAIFDDMIEITSPGVLMVDKDKLGLGYSELRNPYLGALFKKFNIIEQWGTGFEKIQKALDEYPDIQLHIDDDSAFVQVRFVKRVENLVSTEKVGDFQSTLKEPRVGGVNEGINFSSEGVNLPNEGIKWGDEGVNEGIKRIGEGLNLPDEGVNEGVNSCSEGVNEGVNLSSGEIKEGLYRLALFIQKFPGQRLPFYQTQLNTSLKNLERWIAMLKAEGKIEYRGSKKSGGYYVL